MTHDDQDTATTRLEDAAQTAERREELARTDPEPSLGRRFGQIGVLGWMIVIPTLLALLAGHWLDKWLATGIMFSAALTMLGAGLGLWLALQWMHKQ